MDRSKYEAHDTGERRAIAGVALAAGLVFTAHHTARSRLDAETGVA